MPPLLPPIATAAVQLPYRAYPRSRHETLGRLVGLDASARLPVSVQKGGLAAHDSIDPSLLPVLARARVRTFHSAFHPVRALPNLS